MSNLNQNTTSQKSTKNFLLLSLNNEIVVFILISCLLVAGLISDIVPQKSIFGVTDSNNLDSICLVLLQIEATMTAVLIAVIALLSSFSTKSYLGFSLSAYVLDLKPKIFRFRFVLLFELFLLFVVVSGQILQYYNLIITSCAISILLIIVVTKNVYTVFVNANKIYRSIADNFEALINNKDFDYHNFIIDWKQSVSDKNVQQYDDYCQYRNSLTILLKHICECPKYNNKKAEIVRELLNEIAEFQLRTDNIISRKRGVKFVIDAYRGRFGCINSENQKEIITNVFSNEVWNDWWNSLYDFDYEFIEEKCDFIEIFSLIFSNDFLQNKNQIPSLNLDIDIYKNESLDFVYLLSSKLGDLLNKQLSKTSNINTDFWKQMILPIYMKDEAGTFDKQGLYKLEHFKQINKSLNESKSSTENTISPKSVTDIELRKHVESILNTLKTIPEYLKYISLINFYVFKSYLLSKNINLIEDVFFSDKNVFYRVFGEIDSADDTDQNDYLEFEFFLILCFISYVLYSSNATNKNDELCNEIIKVLSNSKDKIKYCLNKISLDYKFILKFDSVFKQSFVIHSFNHTPCENVSLDKGELYLFAESFFIYFIYFIRLFNKNETNKSFSDAVNDVKKDHEVLLIDSIYESNSYLDLIKQNISWLTKNLNYFSSCSNQDVLIKKLFDILSQLPFKDSLNPVLKSKKDINEDLLYKMLKNKIMSLTIDYEFVDTTDDDKSESNPFKVFRLKYKSEKNVKFGFPIYFSDKVHSIASAFEDFEELECVNLNIGPNITNLNSVFKNARKLIYIGNIDNFDTSSVTDMSSMFEGAASFNQQIGSWNTSNVTNMSRMFYDATSFNQPLGSWNTSNVTDMGCMFGQTVSFNQSLDSWDTSNVTDMGCIFEGAISFNQPIGSWDTSRVTYMQCMFEDAISFNQPLDSWDTSNVTIMNGMFKGALSFNQPIGNWDTSNVTDMSNMFWVAISFNQPIGNWNTSNVTDMSNMFWVAISFNQPIGNWNTSNVTDMSRIFLEATSFNQPLDNWDTSSVTGMDSMFEGATSFNQPLDHWDTSNVTDMSSMFMGATSFNQPLDSWDTSSVDDMSDMLEGATSFKYAEPNQVS